MQPMQREGIFFDLKSGASLTFPSTFPANQHAGPALCLAVVRAHVACRSIAPIKEFDPFNLLDGKSKEQVMTWREAELTHCRVGMLASAGFLVQEKFHPLFSGDGGPAIDQIPKLPVFMWFAMTLGIGIAEGYRVSLGWSSPSEPNHVFQKLKPGYIPGDLGFDPLGLKPEDPAEFRAMQTKELQNGRLAMIAAAGFLAQEAVSDTTWGTYWGAADF
ncbi:hypothetical protein AB1Y20_004864 [Prymnesium parvum]|uniref:Uncharacterized protein n=1 Tax=Prymnesium parvum TaxID=97485 RepID=A0AB34IYP7_PRYPA